MQAADICDHKSVPDIFHKLVKGLLAGLEIEVCRLDGDRRGIALLARVSGRLDAGLASSFEVMQERCQLAVIYDGLGLRCHALGIERCGSKPARHQRIVHQRDAFRGDLFSFLTGKQRHPLLRLVGGEYAAEDTEEVRHAFAVDDHPVRSARNRRSVQIEQCFLYSFLRELIGRESVEVTAARDASSCSNTIAFLRNDRHIRDCHVVMMLKIQPVAVDDARRNTVRRDHIVIDLLDALIPAGKRFFLCLKQEVKLFLFCDVIQFLSVIVYLRILFIAAVDLLHCIVFHELSAFDNAVDKHADRFVVICFCGSITHLAVI